MQLYAVQPELVRERCHPAVVLIDMPQCDPHSEDPFPGKWTAIDARSPPSPRMSFPVAKLVRLLASMMTTCVTTSGRATRQFG